MIRKTFPVGFLGCNCTILADPTSSEAIVIDPGDEVDRIVAELAADKLRVVGIVHTHAHVDHIGGAAELAWATGAPCYLHADDRFLHQMIQQQARLVGLPQVRAPGKIEHELVDGTAITFGRYELGVVHTPGHSPGSVCFTMSERDLCFSGDTLFASGIGRTDLWGGDAHAIERSIRDRLYVMNGAVEVIPGHGPNTTIDRERLTNPFVTALR